MNQFWPVLCSAAHTHTRTQNCYQHRLVCDTHTHTHTLHTANHNRRNIVRIANTSTSPILSAKSIFHVTIPYATRSFLWNITKKKEKNVSVLQSVRAENSICFIEDGHIDFGQVFFFFSYKTDCHHPLLRERCKNE